MESSANGMGWSALRVGCKDNHANSASALVLRGRSASSPQGDAREGLGTGFGRYGHKGSKPKHPTWRGCVEVEPRPTAWDGARSALAANKTTPSPPARACSVGDWPLLHRAKRARAAGHGTRSFEYVVPKPQLPSGAVSVKKDLSQRHGVERAPRWPQRQPRQVRQRARDMWAVGLFSTGQSARGLRGTDFGSFDYDVSKPQPPTWRGVGEEGPRPTA